MEANHLDEIRAKLRTLRGKDLAATAQRVGTSYDTVLRIRDGTTAAPSYALVMSLVNALKRVRK
jgi:transcriptional regulator with XRE-family HTH domain